MFEELGEKLDAALGRFRQRGLLTEEMIDEGLREVRRVLLEADVHFRVTKEFLARVKEKATGEEVLKSVTPGQQIVKIVHDELAKLLGDERPSLAWASSAPTVFMLVGLQGSGKTTTAAKLARRLRREGRHPHLAACDVYRPAAVDQLVTLADEVDVPVHEEGADAEPVEVARKALDAARDAGAAALIVDTAGRLQIDEPMMEELRELKSVLEPTEILLVADAMTGQEAVRIAEGFDDALDITGLILTKMDGDARGGAALSMHGVTGKPIKFVGVGERLDALERCDPERLAGRILQMGDVVGLVERAERAIDEEEKERLEKKVLEEGRFDLEDFLTAMRQIQRMGPLDQLLKLIPGVSGDMLSGVDLDPKRLKHMEAIVLSMTPEERRNPKILNGSRRARIARGSGRPVSEVNRLVKQFEQMRKMMEQMKGMKGKDIRGLVPG